MARPALGQADGRESAAASLVPAMVAAAGAVFVMVAAAIPYVRFGPQGGPLGVPQLSILDCHLSGCGWYALEPLGIVAALVATGAGSALRLLPRAVVGWILAVLGLWSALMFSGYLLSVNSDSYGPGSDPGPSGVVGVAGGLVIIGGTVTTLLLGRRRGGAPQSPSAPQPET